MGNCCGKQNYNEATVVPQYSFAANMTQNLTDKDVFKYYELVRVLGEGSMGSVSCVRQKHRAISRYQRKSMEKLRKALNPSQKKQGSNDKYYALKSIQKGRVTPEFLDELRNEIDILKSLDHPNIVKAYEVFDCKRRIHIVMELCSGGDLYSRNPYTESQAAKIIRKLCSAVAYMHDNGVIHRDLKFENIMFENTSADAEIKVIDFGLSKKYKPDENEFSEGVGTIYTMAPQVLQGVYTSQADMWSVGVIAYMLLSSSKPFYHKRRKYVIHKIMSCDYDFKAKIWTKISKEAKDFISNLLTIDPEKRWNADQALKSPWLAGEFQPSEHKPDVKLMEDVNYSLLNYREHTQFKKMALMLIAHKATTSQIINLRKVFADYDTSGDGCINLEEFKNSLAKFGYTEEELHAMFHSIDLDKNGVIFYTEFLAATLEAHGHIEEERLAEAFDKLDYNHSGYITKENLQRALGTDYTPERAQEMMAEVDENKDGKISYEEFLKAFREGKRDEIENAYDEIKAIENDSSSEEGKELLDIDAKIPGGHNSWSTIGGRGTK